MRYDVKKYLFIGPYDERKIFFKRAQDVGLVDFIDMNPSEPKEVSSEIENIITSIKILRGLPTVEQEEMTDYSESGAIVKKILHLKHSLEKLEEEKRVVRLEIARVEVFGDFSLKDIAYIEKEGNRKFQFFFARKGVADEMDLPEGLIYVASDHGLDYFVAVNKEPVQYENMIEMHVEKPLSELQHRFHKVERLVHEKEQELKTYAKYNEFLHHALIYKYNIQNLHTNERYATYTLDDRLFAVEGWVPVHKIETVQNLVDQMEVHMEEIAVEETDRVPTYLENQGANLIGEDLVHIYDTPSVTDTDPSLWVLIFFSLFFAIIIGDGGYGLLFLGLALFLRWKFPNVKSVAKRVLNLFTILCVACVAWGVMTHSFFGINFSMDSPIRKVSVLQWMVEKKTDYHIQNQDETYQEWLKKYPLLQGVQDSKEFLAKGAKEVEGGTNYEIMGKFSDNILMELALLIGVIHISFSLLRYLNRNWPALGWFIFLVGCYFYFPSYLDATSLTQYLFGWDKAILAVQGQYMIFGGIGLAVFLSILQHQVMGFLEIATLIQIFADVLSYLRLYALGLASSILSNTINEIAGSMVLILGIVLLIVGHGVNMVIGVMGGVIHGLRLNFLEWYHYSFEGGGKKFNPLRKVKIE